LRSSYAPFLLPGTTIDWQGLLIAIAVMCLPVIAIDRFVKRWQHTHPGRFLLGGLLIFPVWTLLGPGIADWVTPHFDIGGIWQYAVLLLVDFGLAMAYWKMLTTIAPIPDPD
jgi:hypothetical protein